MLFPAVHEQSLWLAYLLITVFFILLFVFRETISHWKEIWKAKCRKGLYDKMVEVSVVGDTAKTSTGVWTILFNFLDEHFLKPSDDVSYDYLLYGDSDYDPEETDDQVVEEGEEEEEEEEDVIDEEEDVEKVHE